MKLDITGDGSPDEMAYSTAFSCSTVLTLWGGTGGNYLWTVINDGVYEFLAHQWKVVNCNNLNVCCLQCIRAHVVSQSRLAFRR